jgi:hypothetical protein
VSASPTATVRLAAGAGLVARRAGALLFVPARDAVLIEAFTTSAPGAELQAVASTAVGEGFTVGPFVCLSWGPSVQVMAFGDVAVETDQPSLPMLTGAGSRTWVEHSLPLDGDAMIHVAGAEGDVDAATDLAAGVVFAGGFRLELTAAVAAPPPSPAPAIDEPDPPATQAVPRQPAALAPAVDDPIAALAAIQAAAVGADGELLQAPDAPSPAASDAVPVSDVLEPTDPDVTLPPPVAEVLVQAMSEDDDQRVSLVDAKLCGNGHPNPPAVAMCGVCGEFLAPGASSLVHVPRPSLGRLQLDDGELVELDQELLIGRNPDRDTDPQRRRLRRVRLHGDKVSRSHLEIRFQGWEVLVADCGSMNGSFVVPDPGGQVVTLEPGRSQMVQPGATVYFGSRSFTVLGRQPQ